MLYTVVVSDGNVRRRGGGSDDDGGGRTTSRGIPVQARRFVGTGFFGVKAFSEFASGGVVGSGKCLSVGGMIP